MQSTGRPPARATLAGNDPTNYTFVARDPAVQGLNVLAQAVAARGEGNKLRLSLSSNPDVAVEVVETLRSLGQRLRMVGVINRQMPFMPNGAEVPPAFFDGIVTDPAATHAVFGPPNKKVTAADDAIGLHASSPVADGGTLQVGIGSLGDAIAQALIVTLLGAAAGDALESGQVISGVGGQYNFVAMAHALPDARLLMMLRATHETKTGLTSSIVWSYGNVTIPRHLRDIVIAAFGIADLRGRADSEVVKRLIAIADSRLQEQLVKQAQEHGKLEAGHRVPERFRHNLPEMLEETLQPWVASGLLPDFAFGTDLTEDEQHIVRAPSKLEHASTHPVELVQIAVRSLWEGREAPHATLERLGLAEAHRFGDLFMRRRFAGNL